MDPFEVDFRTQDRLRAVDQAISICRPISTVGMSGSPPKTLDTDKVLEVARKIIDFAENRTVDA